MLLRTQEKVYPFVLTDKLNGTQRRRRIAKKMNLVKNVITMKRRIRNSLTSSSYCSPMKTMHFDIDGSSYHRKKIDGSSFALGPLEVLLNH